MTKQEKRRQLRLSFGFGPLFLVILFTVVTAAMGSYLVHSQYEVVRMGYIIDQDLAEYRRQLETVKRLELSIASYKHPKSVTALAEQELDMRAPKYTEEFTVPDPTGQTIEAQMPELEPTPSKATREDHSR